MKASICPKCGEMRFIREMVICDKCGFMDLSKLPHSQTKGGTLTLKKIGKLYQKAIKSERGGEK